MTGRGRVGQGFRRGRALRLLQSSHKDYPFRAGICTSIINEVATAYVRFTLSALEVKDPGLINLKVDPFLDTIRFDPRYAEICGE